MVVYTPTQNTALGAAPPGPVVPTALAAAAAHTAAALYQLLPALSFGHLWSQHCL